MDGAVWRRALIVPHLYRMSTVLWGFSFPVMPSSRNWLWIAPYLWQGLILLPVIKRPRRRRLVRCSSSRAMWCSILAKMIRELLWRFTLPAAISLSQAARGKSITYGKYWFLTSPTKTAKLFGPLMAWLLLEVVSKHYERRSCWEGRRWTQCWQVQQ